MAIQQINLTVPGGDTPRSANTKINANFSNIYHAASKLVGEETGNVMQVGAFGLGGAKQIQSGVLLREQHISGLGSALITSGTVPTDSPDSVIGKVLYLGLPAWGSQVWFSYNYGKVYFRNREAGSEYESWKEFYHSGTSNLKSNSIQVGVGAPKIAYKKITSTFPSNTVIKEIAHGISQSKILSVSVLVELTGQLFPPNYPDTSLNYKVYSGAASVNITAVNATALYNKPLTILITYEV